MAHRTQRTKKPQENMKTTQVKTPDYGGALHQLAWVGKVLHPLIARKFYGKLTLTMRNGQITGAEQAETIAPPPNGQGEPDLTHTG